MLDFLETKAAFTVSDAGEISGVAWVFSRPDQVGDLIERKAFANIKTPLTMLFAHDQTQPIGVWTSIEVTGDTLSVKGKLLVDTVEKAREVYALIKAGAFRGLSIGFRTLKSSPRKGGRTISSLDLKEISAVPVPAHPDAEITSIKSAFKGRIMENDNIEDIETKTVDVAALEEKFTSLETKMSDLSNIGSRLDRIEARLSRPSAPAIIGKAADPAELEKKAFNDFARGVAIDTKQLSVAGTGGVTVPTPLYSELIRNLVLYSPVRSVARVMQVNSDTIKLPKRTTNLTSALVTETALRPESTPTYTSQTLHVYEVGATANVSLQMLEDSVFDLANYLMSDIGVEFGRQEGALLVNGTGVDQPRGIMHNPAAGSIVNAAGASIAPDDIIKLFYSLPSYYAAAGVWLMNRATVGKIRSFKSTTGEYLWAPGTGENGLVLGTAQTLLGRPIIEIPDMPNDAPNTIAVAFGDVSSAYRVVDRISVNIFRDDATLRDYGLVRFHARRRFGGDIVLDEALRYLQTTA